jgi:hypothetical protein
LENQLVPWASVLSYFVFLKKASGVPEDTAANHSKHCQVDIKEI